MPHFECGACNRSATSPAAPGWEAMRDYLKKHRGATLEQVIAATPCTRDDYRLDLKRGALKA